MAFRKGPYPAREGEGERKGEWVLGRRVAGMAVRDDGFVCNKNSSFQRVTIGGRLAGLADGGGIGRRRGERK